VPGRKARVELWARLRASVGLKLARRAVRVSAVTGMGLLEACGGRVPCSVGPNGNDLLNPLMTERRYALGDGLALMMQWETGR
jgi:hypothetical protein